MAYFSSFELFTKIAWTYLMTNSCNDNNSFFHRHRQTFLDSSSSQPVVNFMCGSLSGFCATVLAHPFDVVRTRIISQSDEPKTYQNTRHAFRSIAQAEGLTGFYRGFIPTITQIMPFSGAQFASYNIFKSIWLHHLQSDHIRLELGPVGHINLQVSYFYL